MASRDKASLALEGIRHAWGVVAGHTVCAACVCRGGPASEEHLIQLVLLFTGYVGQLHVSATHWAINESARSFCIKGIPFTLCCCL